MRRVSGYKLNGIKLIITHRKDSDPLLLKYNK